MKKLFLGIGLALTGMVTTLHSTNVYITNLTGHDIAVRDREDNRQYYIIGNGQQKNIFRWGSIAIGRVEMPGEQVLLKKGEWGSPAVYTYNAGEDISERVIIRGSKGEFYKANELTIPVAGIWYVDILSTSGSEVANA